VKEGMKLYLLRTAHAWSSVQLRAGQRVAGLNQELFFIVGPATNTNKTNIYSHTCNTLFSLLTYNLPIVVVVFCLFVCFFN
jgi:hypothetical protein